MRGPQQSNCSNHDTVQCGWVQELLRLRCDTSHSREVVVQFSDLWSKNSITFPCNLHFPFLLCLLSAWFRYWCRSYPSCSLDSTKERPQKNLTFNSSKTTPTVQLFEPRKSGSDPQNVPTERKVEFTTHFVFYILILSLNQISLLEQCHILGAAVSVTTGQAKSVPWRCFLPISLFYNMDRRSRPFRPCPASLEALSTAQTTALGWWWQITEREKNT